jgi:hypothetical protein
MEPGFYSPFYRPIQQQEKCRFTNILLKLETADDNQRYPDAQFIVMLIINITAYRDVMGIMER